MFYLIGLGLDVKGISIEGWEICGKCEKLYLESYTIELPYKIKELEKFLGKKVIELDREQVEGEKFIDEAKTKDIALLAYGSPLAATTHISLVLKCKKENIPFKIFHNASILDAVAETGLQLYKFGKTASMPKWRGSYRPMSFIEIIKENSDIGAHTLLLADIGLNFNDALNQFQGALKKNKLKMGLIIVCSRLGTDGKNIVCENIEDLKNEKINSPFCIIIPSELHFLEEEALGLKEKI